MRKILKNVQDQLNQHEEWEEEFYTYSLKTKKDNIVFTVLDELEEMETIEMRLPEVVNEENILRGLINNIYDDFINSRRRYINQTKGFYARKTKSIYNWLEKENEEKIKAINLEMVERFKINKQYESELNFYTGIVKDLYCALNILQPDWKITDIKNQLEEKMVRFSMDDVTVNIEDNLLICIKNGAIIKMNIDTYSNTVNVINNIINQLRVA